MQEKRSRRCWPVSGVFSLEFSSLLRLERKNNYFWLETFLFLMKDRWDFVIVGSGFGGSVAALRLAEKGYKVLVIEQGKRFQSSDFARTNWNLRKYLWLPRLGFHGIQKLSFFRQASILSGVGVGGGSLVYANTLYEPPDEFFSQGPWAALGDWKNLLKPFYDRAGKMLGRTPYPKMNPEDQYLHRVASEMGREHSFQNVYVGVHLGDPEVESDPYFDGNGPLRKGCIECAGCMVGCRENAKNTLDKNYLYFAEKLGVRILSGTRAERVEFRDGIYRIGTCQSSSLSRKRLSWLETRSLVLAGGTLGTLELLLKQKYKYKTLPRLSPRLGEELRTNSETLCAVSGTGQKLNNGLAITSVFHPDPETHVEIVKYPDGSNLMKIFFTLAAGKARNPFLRTAKLGGQILRHPLNFLRSLFGRRWSASMVIFLVMQSRDNAMRMIWKKGLFEGRMKIDNTGNRKVPAFIPVGQKVMEAYARETGGVAQNIILEVLFDRPTTAHILGGCPMGSRPEEGVIDASLRVHGYPNMWITDGSSI